MSAAILTAFFFALSAIFGARSAKIFGASTANLGRVLVALTCLSFWAFTIGHGISGAGFRWFFLSGCIGFGLGDLALFGALPRIGPRLSILLTQCLAGPVAGLAEWLWLGQSIAFVNLLLSAMILFGVVVALLPDRRIADRRFFYGGVGFGVLSAIGQGLGAVVSRKAIFLNAREATVIDGGTAAFQRMLGGFALTLLFIFVTQPGFFQKLGGKTRAHLRELPAGLHYILLNGLIGPCVGVGFYQFALSTTPSAIVLAIVATSPVLVMLLQYLLKEEKPGWLSASGGLLAVGGAILLAIKNR